MKKYFATLALGVALAVATPKAFADTSIATETGSAEAPNSISVEGSIDQYVNFTTVDGTIDLGNMGGPRHYAPYIPADSAKFEGGSNTHIHVDVTFGDNLTLDETPFSHADQSPQIPIEFETQVKGTGLADYVPFGNPNDYTNLNESPKPWTPAGTFMNVQYEPGPLGMIIRAKVLRDGLNDHYGDYSTEIMLSWVKH